MESQVTEDFVPDALQKRPQLDEVQSYYVTAYSTLTREGGISPQDVESYCRIMADDDVEFMLLVMKGIEARMSRRLDKKREQDKAKTQNRTPPRSRPAAFIRKAFGGGIRRR